VVLEVGGIALFGGDFEGQRDEKNKGVIKGLKMPNH